jgi:hypothetical protein
MRNTSRLTTRGALGLSAALMLLLAACGEPAEEQQGSATPSDAPATAATTTDGQSTDQ